MIQDKNKKDIVLQDYEASTITGIQIGSLGHKLWVCIDGVAVLRVVSPRITLDDFSKSPNTKLSNLSEQLQQNLMCSLGDFENVPKSSDDWDTLTTSLCQVVVDTLQKEIL